MFGALEHRGCLAPVSRYGATAGRGSAAADHRQSPSIVHLEFNGQDLIRK
jgi:hypothetical protein